MTSSTSAVKMPMNAAEGANVSASWDPAMNHANTLLVIAECQGHAAPANSPVADIAALHKDIQVSFLTALGLLPPSPWGQNTTCLPSYPDKTPEISPMPVTQVLASEFNVSYLMDFNHASTWTFSGAQCAYAGIYIPTDPAQALSHLTLDLIALDDYLAAIDPIKSSIDITNAPKLASCTGAACNATGTEWLAAADLEPEYVYVVVLSKDGSLPSVDSTSESSGFIMLQAATGGEHCFRLLPYEVPCSLQSSALDCNASPPSKNAAACSASVKHDVNSCCHAS